MRMLLGNSLWHLVAQADAMTKFVLFGLLVASIVCWTVIFYKLVLLNLKKKQLQEVIKKLKTTDTLAELVSLTNKELKGYPGYLLSEQLMAAKEVLDRAAKTSVTHQEAMMLDEQRMNIIEEMLYIEETYLPVLAVTAAVAPLVGLFGTVWGLTHSFISISEKQAADIVTIAPGIAEALLTTLGGLMVAIPVAVMYHYLKGQVEKVEYNLLKISEKVHTIVRISLLDGKDGSEISIVPEKAPKRTVAS